MNARPLLLVAAGLAVAASETALWLQMRDTLRAQAEIQRQLTEHRCPVVPAAVPVPTEAVFSPPVFEPSPFLPVRTDPALETHRGR